MADLDTIMSGRVEESAPSEPIETTSTTDASQPRDPHGRFASPQQEQQPPAQPTPPTGGVVETTEQKPPEGFIPIQALDARLAKMQERHDAALRQQAEQFQQQFMQFRQPQQPQEPPKQPDYYEDPNAAVDFRVQQTVAPLQQGQQAIIENFSRMMASDKFGEEAINAAYAEMKNRMGSNPQQTRFDYQRIMSSPHPYGELVKWHKAQSAIGKYGDDPDAFINAEIERRLAERTQQPPAQTQQPQQVLPTSFAGARNAGPASAQQFSGPRPLSEIMGGR